MSVIRPYFHTDVIKVITGIRRAGKSVILDSIRNELMNSGINEDHIVFMNFEDIDLEYLLTAKTLNDEIKSRIEDEGKYYLLFDEIQHVSDFEKVLSSLRAVFDVSIFVTGSNSRLLSGELSSLLTGRCVEFEILPFAFSEALEYCKENGRLIGEKELFLDYMKLGGFPARYSYSDEASAIRYLESVYDGIINRDILLSRKGIDKALFKRISLYIIANAGRELSPKSISNYCKSNKIADISERSVYNYVQMLESAFLIHRVERYDIVGKSALGTRAKYYATDTGMRIVNSNRIQWEDTFYLENVVFNELRTRGYEVFSGKTRNGEIDFVVVRNGRKCFIQVAYLLASEQTIEREFGAFDAIRDQSPKYVMSLDEFDFSRNGVGHINIMDFLLGRADIVLL